MIKKLAFGGLAAGCAIAALMLATGERPEAATLPETDRETHSSTMAAIGATKEDPGAGRKQIVSAVPIGPEVAPYLFEFEVHARTRYDYPAANVTIWLGPEHHPLNSASTGPDGVLRVQWRGRASRMTIVWAAPGDSTNGQRLQRTALQAGTTTRVPLRLDSGVLFEVSQLRVISFDATVSRPADYLRPPPPLHIDDAGVAWFSTGFDAIAPESLEPARGVILDVAAQVLTRGVIEFADSTEEARVLGTIRGRVRNSDGNWARKVIVGLQTNPEHPPTRTVKTDDDGNFTIESVEPGSYHLRAGGGDEGIAHAQLAVQVGQEVQWHGDLDRGHELIGRVSDRDGKHLKGWHVEARLPGDPTWIDGAVTGPDGRFAIPNVLSGPHSLRFSPPEGKIYIPYPDQAFPDADTSFVMNASKGSKLSAAPTLPDGTPYPFAELRLWRDDYDEGIRFNSSTSKSFATDLPQGTYRVVLGGPGLRYESLLNAQVGTEPADLGEIPVPELTSLEIPEGIEMDSIDSVALHLHATVASRVGTFTAEDRRRMIPPGDLVIRIGDQRCDLNAVRGPNWLVPPERQAVR